MSIYEVKKASMEMYQLVSCRYQNLELPWLRWWDIQSNLLLTGWERSQRLAAKLKELCVNHDKLV